MASQKMNPGYVDDMGMDMHKEALTGAVTSDPVLVGGRFRRVSVGVGALAVGATIQYTLDSPADVEAGTAAWISWSTGEATENTADYLQGPVTAVRCVSTGNAEWFINAAP